MDYLLRPPSSQPSPRPRSAIAVIVLYSILLFFVAITYFRLLYTVATNPGYVSRGPQWYTLNKERGRQRGSGWAKERSQKDKTTKTQAGKENNDAAIGTLRSFQYEGEPVAIKPNAADKISPDLQDIYSRDVFTCEGNGRPIWCYSCCNWKPDRAHHCREIGRCVRKMDHFCPWSVVFFL